MKKITFFLTAMLFVALFVAAGSREDSYVLFANFENGIPEGWTQETVVGNQLWAVESENLQYPSTAYSGTHYLALRNTTGQTQHFVTRLITPVIDISMAACPRPILVFSHVQHQYSGDVDELRVYYRASENDPWTLYSDNEYTERVTNWKNDTIRLTAGSSTYQLAFEATDNYGRGVVLDDIIVRPEPTCINPSNIKTERLSVNDAKLIWDGSFDTDTFHLIISETEVDDLNNPGEVLIDTKLFNAFEYETDTILSQDTKYFVYIQAICSNGESSGWSEGSFHTQNVLKLPYTQTFDVAYIPNSYIQMPYWYYGTSLLDEKGNMEQVPFVNQLTETASRKYYTWFNKSTCLVFAGTKDMTKPIPAGSYVYATSPELTVTDLSKVQVSFWGTAYQHISKDYESGIKVGVMTDPNDFSTFEEVATVHVKDFCTFKRFTVYFDKYTGEGKHIAFVSNFANKNIFFIDQVQIVETEGTHEFKNVKLDNYAKAGFDVIAENDNATHFNIYVTRPQTDLNSYPILDISGYQASDILFKVENQPVSNLPYHVVLPDSLEGTQVQVFLQAVKDGNAALCNAPVKTLIPLEGAFNTKYDFETGVPTYSKIGSENYRVSVTDIWTYYNGSVTLPTYAYTGLCGAYMARKANSFNSNLPATSIMLNKFKVVRANGEVEMEPEYGAYIAFPYFENMSEVVISFDMTNFYLQKAAKVAVGVMTNPFDPSTFVKVAEFEDPDFSPTKNLVFGNYRTALSDYQGTGHYPAIMAIESSVIREDFTAATSGILAGLKPISSSEPIIDNVVFSSIAPCDAPVGGSVTTDVTSATVNWPKGGASSWIVRWYSDDKATTMIDSAIVATNSYTINGLYGRHQYWYTITTTCGDSVANTSALNTFVTLMPEEYDPLPYEENFEMYGWGDKRNPTIPYGWVMPQRVYTEDQSGNRYPRLHDKPEGIGSSKCLYFGSDKGQIKDTLYFALPKMKAAVKDVQLTFNIKAAEGSSSNKIVVGVMSDPNNLETFEEVATIQVKNTDYKKVVVPFDTYKGTGRYIAIAKLSVSPQIYYIDEIVVDYISGCIIPQDIVTSSPTDKGATFNWQAIGAAWEIVVADSLVNPDEAVKSQNGVVERRIVNSLPVVFASDDVMPGSTYNLYVRTVCSEDSKSEWIGPVAFNTACAPRTAGEFGFWNVNMYTGVYPNYGDGSALECWTLGVIDGTPFSAYFHSNYGPTSTTNGNPKAKNPTEAGALQIGAGDGSSMGGKKCTDAYAILPPLNIDSITRLQISFRAASLNLAQAKDIGMLTVGVITDPSDFSTFEEVRTIDIPKSTTCTAAEYEKVAKRCIVSLANYSGDMNGDWGKYIVLMTRNNNGANCNTVNIGDVRIDTIPACPELGQMEVTNLTDTLAEITWEDVADKYEVRLSTKELVDVIDVPDILNNKVVTENKITLSNLKPLSTYYFYVRPVCSETEKGEWSFKTVFTTDCPAVIKLTEGKYTQNFDDHASTNKESPTCWQSLSYNTTNYPYCYSSAKHAGTNGLYFYCTKTAYEMAVLPAFDIPVENLKISFWGKRMNAPKVETPFILGVATDISSLSQAIATLHPIDTVLVDKNTWLQYTFEELSYDGPEGYLVLYQPKYPSTASTNVSLYVDDFVAERVLQCKRVTSIAEVAATETTATLAWQPAKAESAWDITYVLKDSLMDAATATWTRVTEPTFKFEGLKMGTRYDAYIRSYCGDDVEGEISEAFEFATISKVAPMTWNFESSETATAVNSPNKDKYIPYTWVVDNSSYDHVYTSAAGFAYIENNAGVSSSHALNMASTPLTRAAYAVLPMIESQSYDTLQLTFSAKAATSKAGVVVGTMTNPYDASTFESFAEFQLSGVMVSYSMALCGAQGKFIAFYSDYFDADNALYLDNVAVNKLSGVPAPTMVRINPATLTTKHADITWNSCGSAWNIKVVRASDNEEIVPVTAVTATSFSTDALLSGTEFVLSIQTVDNATTSPWTSITFSTPCGGLSQEEYFFDFNNVGAMYTEALATLPDCWFGGQALIANRLNTANYPSIVMNTATYTYSRNEGVKDGALRLSNVDATDGNSYVVLPATDFDITKKVLHFLGRAAFFRAETYEASKCQLAEANNKYAKDLVIGLMTDPADPATFTQITTVSYAQSWSAISSAYSYNDSINNYWSEYYIALADFAGKEGRIAIQYPANGSTGYFFIDNLEIINEEICMNLSNLSITDINSHSAKVTWNLIGRDAVDYELATDEDFENVIKSDRLLDAKGTLNLAELSAGTTYYVRVMHICNEDKETDWIPTEFTTLYEPFFAEKFVNRALYPANWKRADGPSGTNISEDTYPGWSQNAEDEDIVCTTGATGENATYWLMTPQFDLTNYTDSLILSFDIRLTSQTSDITPKKPSSLDAFELCVSTDEGATFQSLSKWTVGGAKGNNYSDFSPAKTNIHMDVTKFNGKKVLFAFVTIARGSYNYIHLDNVQLNAYTSLSLVGSTCMWEDYEDEYFYIDGAELEVGINKIDKFVPAKKAPAKDALVSLELIVSQDAVTSREVRLCSGEDYNFDGFTISSVTKSGVYKRKMQGVNHCDSTIMVNIQVDEVNKTVIEETICSGTFYEFAGKRYYTNTTLVDTFTSVVTGCDSIVAFYLTVESAYEGERENIYLCEGSSYDFHKFHITEAGLYIDTIKTEGGCDSIVSAQVYKAEKYNQIIRAAVCPGDRYSGIAAFEGMSKEGDYKYEGLSVHGCDSVVTLHLLVVDGSTNTIKDVVSVDQLPYVLNDVELLPAGTKEGQYTKQLSMPCGDITVEITVGVSSAIVDINAVPNSLKKVVVNGRLYINRNDEWYDALGKSVKCPL